MSSRLTGLAECLRDIVLADRELRDEVGQVNKVLPGAAPSLDWGSSRYSSLKISSNPSRIQVSSVRPELDLWLDDFEPKWVVDVLVPKLDVVHEVVVDASVHAVAMCTAVPNHCNRNHSICHGFVHALALRTLSDLLYEHLLLGLNHNGFAIMTCTTAARACVSKACNAINILY